MKALRKALGRAPEKAPGDSAARYGYLDGLRGIAALNVAVSHAVVAFDFALYTGDTSMSHYGWDVTVSAWPFLLPVAGANFSVCVFFVLSGFVLSHAFARSSLGMLPQALKRTVRLALPIFLTTLLSWALLAGHLMPNRAAAAITRSWWLATQMNQPPVFLNALWQGAIGGLMTRTDFATTFNSSLWTMPVEFLGSMVLIAAFAIGGVAARQGGTRVAGGACLLALGLLFHAYCVSLFGFGAALYLLNAARLPQRLPTFAPWLLLVVALLLGTVPYSGARGPLWDGLASLLPLLTLDHRLTALAGFEPLQPVGVWHAVGAVLLLFLVEGWPAMRQALASPWLRTLGHISFPLYLMHVPLLMSVGCGSFLALQQFGLPYGQSALVATVVYLATALIAAAIGAVVIEAPAVRLAALAGGAAQRLLRQIGRFSVGVARPAGL